MDIGNIREGIRRRLDGDGGDDDDDDARPRPFVDFLRGMARTTEVPYKGLKIMDVDLMIKENSVHHHTDKYNEDIDEPGAKFVVRRGFPIHIKVSFTRPINLEEDKLRFVFKTGEKPLPGDGTYVSILPSNPESKAKWGVEILEVNEKEVSFAIHTPPNCIVSAWNFEVQILEEEDDREVIHTSSDLFPLSVYILFNPWNQADPVYFNNEECRQEYVLNDEGNIWISDSDTHIDWYFKQFDKDILDCTMYLLDQCYLRMKHRGDAVLVSRAMSAAGNKALRGNWSGNYDGGTAPYKWLGSAKILQEYYKTKTIVRYGQCWVFSGILTTKCSEGDEKFHLNSKFSFSNKRKAMLTLIKMCRAIGIPCRSVTNFSSAHDTDGSITIDEYFTLTGDELDGQDSVWNFHVWNEVWMDRPDLPREKKYGGWQAIDCTPQELSDGRYQCGPMPVSAIKVGDVALNYDGPFIFGEVNADRAVWLFESYDKKYLMDIDTDSVGVSISTRALPKDGPGSEGESEREDLTNSYKYKEGSPKEKDARIAANLTTSDNLIYTVPEQKSVWFYIERMPDRYYGQDLVLKLKAKNMVTENQSVYGYITIKSADYRGKPKKILKSERFEATVENEKEFEMKMEDEDYKDKLFEGCYVSVVCCFITKETNQGSICREMIKLKKPKLQLKVLTDEVEINKTFAVQMEFTNPLKRSLTECEIDIEGSGLKIPDDLDLKRSDVGPSERFVSQVEVKATKKGKRKITAIFNAKEIYDVTGSASITVK